METKGYAVICIQGLNGFPEDIKTILQIRATWDEACLAAQELVMGEEFDIDGDTVQIQDLSVPEIDRKDLLFETTLFESWEDIVRGREEAKEAAESGVDSEFEKFPVEEEKEADFVSEE